MSILAYCGIMSLRPLDPPLLCPCIVPIKGLGMRLSVHTCSGPLAVATHCWLVEVTTANLPDTKPLVLVGCYSPQAKRSVGRQLGARGYL